MDNKNFKQILSKQNESKHIKTNEENQLVCPHCKQIIKRKELKVKDKSIIHGKCEGKVYFEEDTDLYLSEDLFKNKAEYVKGRMSKKLWDSLKKIDLSSIGNLGDTPTKPGEYVSGDELKNAKQGKRDKTFKLPKQNR